MIKQTVMENASLLKKLFSLLTEEHTIILVFINAHSAKLNPYIFERRKLSWLRSHSIRAQGPVPLLK